MSKRRVVISGLGVISPIGSGLGPFWDGLVRGASGIGKITRFPVDDYPCKQAAEVQFDVEDYIGRREARKMDRFSQFAVVASRMAMDDAGFSAGLCKDRAGVIIGTGIGGMETFEREVAVLLSKGPSRVSPFFIPMMIANMAAGQVSIDLGLKGPINTVVAACASGANAIGDAYGVIVRGDADVMLSGGTEAPITPGALAGFSALRALSTRNDMGGAASSPFDRDRDGFIMGEGAASLVLEELEHALARGAHIYAEVLGYGMSSDAYHVTAPSPNGDGAARAMKEALRSAGIGPSDIDYINAHGTSTPPNDVRETQAIKTVFGEHAYHLSISSVKSMIGHLLGAAGALETVAAILTLEHQMIPPTTNYVTPDPACDLDYVPNHARSADVGVVLKNSFGFGGQNACLVLSRYVQ